jgi:uridine kinase
MRPRIIGIAGPSCSGKGEIAGWLYARIPAAILDLDGYYRDQAHLTFEQRQKMNYDVPEAIEHELLIEHVEALAQGRSIEKPVYDFTRHTRTGKTVHFEPPETLILDGLFTLFWPKLRDSMHFLAFVDAPDGVCLARRLARDTVLRGRTPEDIERQFREQVQPCAELYVRPTRRHADLILDGTRPVAVSGAELLAKLTNASKI